MKKILLLVLLFSFFSLSGFAITVEQQLFEQNYQIEQQKEQIKELRSELKKATDDLENEDKSTKDKLTEYVKTLEGADKRITDTSIWLSVYGVLITILLLIVAWSSRNTAIATAKEESQKLLDDWISKKAESDFKELAEKKLNAKLQEFEAKANTQLKEFETKYEAELNAIRQQVKITDEKQDAERLFSKAYRLGQEGKREKAIEIYDELITQYRDSMNETVREQVAMAMLYKATEVGIVYGSEKAIKTYDELIKEFKEVKIDGVQEQVAKAMRNKADEVGKLFGAEMKRELHSEIYKYYKDTNLAKLPEEIKTKLIKRRFNIKEPYVTEFQNVIKEHTKSLYWMAESIYHHIFSYEMVGEYEPRVFYKSVMGSVSLSILEKFSVSEAIPILNNWQINELFKTFDHELEKWKEMFGEETAIALKEAQENGMHDAMNSLDFWEQRIKNYKLWGDYKGYAITLVEDSKREEAIEAYNALIDKYKPVQIDSVQEQVVMAMLSRAIVVGKLYGSEEEIKAYEELIVQFKDVKLDIVQEQVAMAMRNKAIEVGKLYGSEEAIKAYEELIVQFKDVKLDSVKEQVAKAMRNKAIVVGKLYGSEEEIKAYEELIVQFKDVKLDIVQEQVAMAILSRAIVVDKLYGSEEAIKAYEELIVQFKDVKLDSVQEQVAFAMQYKYEYLIIKNKTLSKEENEWIENTNLKLEDKGSFGLLSIIDKARESIQDDEIIRWKEEYKEIKSKTWSFEELKTWIDNSSHNEEVKNRISGYIDIFEKHLHRD